MNMTVLVENTTPSSRFAARHGLSLWIEACGMRMLFDMGPDDAFLRNARALGIDIRKADLAIVSHGHADHGGGLGAYLMVTAGCTAPVYLHAGAFTPHVSGTARHHHAIGLDAALAVDARLHVVDEPVTELAPGVTLFTCPVRTHAQPSGNARLFTVEEGAVVPDRFDHEQSLLLQEGERRVLVSACSHAGILNIMDEAERIAGAPLDLVVAGMHLTSPSAGIGEPVEVVEGLARELAARQARYVTFHCTGLAGLVALRDVLGERIEPAATGSVFTW